MSSHNMKFFPILFLMTLVSASLPPGAEAKPLKVVTSTTDLASITRSIGGKHVTVTSLTSGKEDPHFLPPKPSFIVLVRDADLWIRIGMDLEVGWEGPILDGARNRRIREGNVGHLDVSEGVMRLDVPAAPVSRAMGDVHPEGNPHFWLDPFNGRVIAETIAKRLSQLAPKDAEDFEENLALFHRGLDIRMFGQPMVDAFGGETLWVHQRQGRLEVFLEEKGWRNGLGGWVAMMEPFQNRRIVIQHRSWIYFTHRFGIEVVAELEPKPGIPPSAPHLQDVIRTVEAEGVKVILLEPFYGRKPADFVAGKTGARVVVCTNSVGGDPEAADYLSLIDLIARRLGEAF